MTGADDVIAQMSARMLSLSSQTDRVMREQVMRQNVSVQIWLCMSGVPEYIDKRMRQRAICFYGYTGVTCLINTY